MIVLTTQTEVLSQPYGARKMCCWLDQIEGKHSKDGAATLRK